MFDLFFVDIVQGYIYRFRGATVARKPNTLEVARSTLAGISNKNFLFLCLFPSTG